MMNSIFHQITRKFPDLDIKLKQADIYDKPHEFIKKTFIGSLYFSFGICIWFFLMLPKFKFFILFSFPFVFLLMFFYLMKIPDAKLMKKGKNIDREIVFAGKFMIIELNSGVSLYQVMQNIAKNYGGIGEYFTKIVQDIDLGTETQEAINNAIISNPSDNFRKVMWQLSNSISTGSNISLSLNTVLDQISKNQMIEVEKYGKKLNPIATFYLMLAVIIPSLGMVMGVVFASFMNIRLSLTSFILIAFMFMLFQFMFYAIIKVNRPAVDI